jgi:hypothetical protein
MACPAVCAEIKEDEQGVAEFVAFKTKLEVERATLAARVKENEAWIVSGQPGRRSGGAPGPGPAAGSCGELARRLQHLPTARWAPV